MEIKIFPGWEAVVTRVLHFSTLEHPVPVAGGSRLGRSCLSTLRQFSSLPKQGCTHQNAAPPSANLRTPKAQHGSQCSRKMDILLIHNSRQPYRLTGSGYLALG